MTAAEIAERLRGRPVRPGRWMVKCPAHGPERTASLSIREGDDGRTLLFCFGQHCHEDLEGLTAAIGITVADLFPEGHRNNPRAFWRDSLSPADAERLQRLETLVREIRGIDRRDRQVLEEAWAIAAPEIRHLSAEQRAELYAWVEELHACRS